MAPKKFLVIEVRWWFDLYQCYCLIGGCEKLRRDGGWDSWEARKKRVFFFNEGKKGEFGDSKRELRDIILISYS